MGVNSLKIQQNVLLERGLELYKYFFIKKFLFSSPLDFSSSIFSDMRFLKVGIR